MKIKNVIKIIEEIIPPIYAEGFDNTGLLVGDVEAGLKGILITHDTLESVVEEAVDKGLNLIVSFHPIIFNGLKSLTGLSYVERTVMKAVKNDIAIYAVHTALDNQSFGVSGILANKLGLQNQQVLQPQPDTLRQLVTYVPVADSGRVRDALFEAGAGSIGDYAECSFNIQGTGTFKPLEKANPYIGERGSRHYEKEERISVIYPKHLEAGILKNLFAKHPYEEVAYEIFSLQNTHKDIGLGIIGDLPEPVAEMEYLKHLKQALNLTCIRYSGLRGRTFKKVAILGGSGSFAIQPAKALGADLLITADLKYHDFFQGENEIVLADIGHFESEQYTKSFLFELLTKKIRKFAVALSEINTNPINYL